MASLDVYVKGKVRNFRHHQPNEWNKWSHCLYPDPESLEILRDLQARGAKNQMKKDEDGYFMWINRPTSIEVKGKVVGMQPPLVLMADGITPLQGVLVGNGSDVTTKLEVYEHRVPGTPKKAVAFRWKSTRVDNLIPFEPKRDFTEEEAGAARGLEDQPKPVF